MNKKLPQIIQGGMGVAVSDWRLAKAVSKQGQLGVVSGTALDTVLVRRLQLGDKEGHIRRALNSFPCQETTQKILDKYFIEGGKEENTSFKIIPLTSLEFTQASAELIIVANFVEVFLAKEDHSGVVGINFLQKIQLPTLPSLFGAMLANVDYVLMGAGLPIAIPAILDSLSEWKKVELNIHVDENPERLAVKQFFNPTAYVEPSSTLQRPSFIGIVSSQIAAKTIVRKAHGSVEGFVIENHQAGGHNAPPRTKDADGKTFFGAKDQVDLDQIRKLEKPFWLAGSCASGNGLKNAIEQGAQGIQVGSVFAYCEESGISPIIKKQVIHSYKNNTLEVKTDFQASPTGYPFKVIKTNDEERQRESCDLGYLRHSYVGENGKVSHRCPSEKVSRFTKSGGCEETTMGKQCLCNGLLATVGLGQVRNMKAEKPLLTIGEDLSFFDVFLDNSDSYTASEVVNHLLEAVDQ